MKFLFRIGNLKKLHKIWMTKKRCIKKNCNK